MKIIRMTKTMAGPGGIYAAGLVRKVEDGVAAMLIGSGAAILAPGVVQPTTPTPPPAPSQAGEGSEPETAAVEGAAEVAVQAKPLKRKAVK